MADLTSALDGDASVMPIDSSMMRTKNRDLLFWGIDLFDGCHE